MKGTSYTTITEWYKTQSKYRVHFTGRHFLLYDKINCITVVDGSTWQECAEFAYDLVHGLLTVDDDTLMLRAKCREMLRNHKKELTEKLSIPLLTKRQRDVLGLMLDITTDALQEGVFKE